jgi:hypothetical protein
MPNKPRILLTRERAGALNLAARARQKRNDMMKRHGWVGINDSLEARAKVDEWNQAIEALLRVAE